MKLVRNKTVKHYPDADEISLELIDPPDAKEQAKYIYDMVQSCLMSVDTIAEIIEENRRVFWVNE